jgi:aspartyl-tRNA(Asn)/glutamyl-tRNA(Gln) amidotransferase subunit A
MSKWLPISDIANGVNSGKLSASQLVEQALSLIEENKQYNAVISSMGERAKARAAQIDQKVKNGETAGLLAGVPFIAKDNFLTFGGETTAASNILRGFEAPYQATAIEKLEAEGAICVAKANLDAFAHGGSTENSDFGTTLNPVDPTRVPGGSSGGSAASVALDIVPFALGTDTGGSCREPASFSGCVGYKPTYGLISRYGVVAMASSTDVIGLLTRNSIETAYLLDILAGKDRNDATTIDRQDSYKIGQQINTPVKVGVVKEFMGEGVDSGVKQAVIEAIDRLRKNGVEVVEISIPSIELALACYYIIVPAEISSNLSRYDGQRYGYSAGEASNLEESYSKSRGIGLNSENKRRIMIGTYVLSSGYCEAYYKKAAKLRTRLIDEFTDAYKNVDFLIGPTAPSVAPKIGENSDDPLKMYLLDIMTVPVNLVGVPAISIPCGLSDGLPVGLQIIGRSRMDKELIEFANQCEGAL